VLGQVEQVAITDSIVLIQGETGVGKDVLARVIHNRSSRKNRVMVKVNCASLPPSLIESELFGREKGAYTGALTKQVGRFEVADGSTIFLDEIGELSLELQAKLLRVLQDGEFERLGSPQTIKVDVRVIAATNQDLMEQIRLGKFREDLYYRLNVFYIQMPPLRLRKEDIPVLVWTFVEELGEKMGKKNQTIPKKTMDALQSYPWPGNIRQLRNVIEQAMILSSDEKLQIQLPEYQRVGKADVHTLEQAERQHIIETLKITNWHIKGPNGAARLLALKPSTLYSKMAKLNIPTVRVRNKQDEISS
jgi:transcriptional regulator with GAF, ATPase, and Fis domain